MSISIYYVARRGYPLKFAERAAVDRLVTEYTIRDQVERYIQTHQGHNGMDFCVYDPEQPTEEGIIFEGATQLPSNDSDALWDLVRHWCRLLSAVRRAVPTASWHVNVDDHDIQWDEAQQSYDPTA